MNAIKNSGWGHSNIRRKRSHSLGHRRPSSVGKIRQDDVTIDRFRVLDRSKSLFSLVQESNQNSLYRKRLDSSITLEEQQKEKKTNDLIAKIKEKYNKSATKIIQHQNQEKRDESSIPSSLRKKI